MNALFEAGSVADRLWSLLLLTVLLCGMVVEPRTLKDPTSLMAVTIHTHRSAAGQWQAEVEVTHDGGISDLVVSYLAEESEGEQPTVHSKTTISAGNMSTGGLPCPALVSSSVQFTCAGSTPCSDPQQPGTRVAMACKEDHVTRGGDTGNITCLAVGSWSNPVLSCKKVPDGYEFFPGLGWYQLYVVGNTFEQAKRICEFDGGHMGVIDTPGELEALTSLVNRSMPPINNEHPNDIYMGVRKQGNEYTSIYSGRPMSASYHFLWCHGRPPAKSPLGDCTIFTTHTSCHWDSSCGRKLRFLCEIPLNVK